MSLIETLRTPKIPLTGGMVFFDWMATFLFAYSLKLLNFNMNAVVILFIILILLSIPIHIYFDIPTMTNYYLGLSKIQENNKLKN